jgi:hypothetical protein
MTIARKRRGLHRSIVTFCGWLRPPTGEHRHQLIQSFVIGLSIQQPGGIRWKYAVQERIEKYCEDLQAAVLCKGLSQLVASPSAVNP